MSRHVGLASRVKRLERQRRASRPRRTVLFVIAPVEAPGDVIGLSGASGHVIARAPGEPLGALDARASAELGRPRIILARYAAEAPQLPLAVVPAPPIVQVPHDPYSLAGIGHADPRYQGWWQPKAGNLA